MGKYLETQGNREVEIINGKIESAKAKGKTDLLNGNLEKQSLGLARYIAAIQAEEALNQYGGDMEAKSRSALVDDTTLYRQASSIANSQAFKDATKGMSNDDFENIYDNEEKIKEIYTQYTQSNLQKAAEPKYTLMSAERKAQVTADAQAAEKKKEEMKEVSAKKQAELDKKAAKEAEKKRKAEEKQRKAAEKKAAKEAEKKRKAEEKQRKAEEKKKKAEEKRLAKEAEKKRKAEEKQRKAEEKKRLKEASKQKKEPVKTEPKAAAPAFDSVKAINDEYKKRQDEVVYATDVQLSGEKTKIAFAVQTEITKNQLMANSAQYKSQAEVFQKFSTGAVLKSAKQLLSDEKFNKFYDSLSTEQIDNVIMGATSTKEICAGYENFVPQMSPEVEHYTKTMEEGIASQRKRIMDTMNNPSLDANTKKTTYEKSMANIMTYKAMEQKLEKDGANMTKEQMRELCNNTNAQRSRDKLMQDKTFKEMCNSMTEKDYRVIGENKMEEHLPEFKAKFNAAQKKANEVTTPQKEKQASGMVL